MFFDWFGTRKAIAAIAAAPVERRATVAATTLAGLHGKEREKVTAQVKVLLPTTFTRAMLDAIHAGPEDLKDAALARLHADAVAARDSVGLEVLGFQIGIRKVLKDSLAKTAQARKAAMQAQANRVRADRAAEAKRKLQARLDDLAHRQQLHARYRC